MWRTQERRDGRCARRGVAPSSPARSGQPYPVRPVESVPGSCEVPAMEALVWCLVSAVPGTGSPVLLNTLSVLR